MRNRNVLIVLSILAFITIVGGISFSYFVYNKDLGDVSINTGEISINYSDVSGNMTLTGIIPKSDSEGKISTDYIDFTVDGTVDTEKIYYEVYIMPKSGNTIDTQYIKTYLTDQNDQVLNNVSLYNSLSDSEKTGGKRLYREVIDLNNDQTAKTYTKDFRLRVWIDNSFNESTSKKFDFDIYLYAKNVDLDFEIDTSALGKIKKNVITPTNPINFANASSSTNGQGLYILPGTEDDDFPIYYYRGAVNNNNVIFGGFCWQMVRTTDTGGIKMIYNGIATGNGTTCENTAHADRIISSSAFNSQYNTMADVGYMKNNNARYTYTNAEGASGSIYGKKVEWDGTNYLVIDDTANTASSNTAKDNNHHYSCGTAGTTSCESVRYYYYNNYYITLTSGDFVEDAIYKMTGNIVNPNIDVVTRNSGYILNNTDSTVKTAIESWFRTNLTNEVDNTKINYVNYLEDTVYCNDRSVKMVSGNESYPTYQESGWNPSGGDLTKYLYFGTNNRVYNSWYSTTNVPSVVCPNETDRFSVSSSVAHLNYPVGLLTADEIVMAGASGSSSTSNNTYYLYTGNYYWSLSPYNFYCSTANGFFVYDNGRLINGDVNNSLGVRPVVSLKPGTGFESGGDGTPTNPYIVKYE